MNAAGSFSYGSDLGVRSDYPMKLPFRRQPLLEPDDLAPLKQRVHVELNTAMGALLRLEERTGNETFKDLAVAVRDIDKETDRSWQERVAKTRGRER